MLILSRAVTLVNATITFVDPYAEVPQSGWKAITEELVAKHPLVSTLPELCLQTWESILNTKINTYLNLRVGDMGISPQAVSNLIHDILPEHVVRRDGKWKKGSETHEKDLVYLPDDKYSFELKVSSSPRGIFGNRSYAQRKITTKKINDGYYLALNIDKLTVPSPKLRLIRFGWLSHSDWVGQQSQSGQQARLSPETLKTKFVTLLAND